MRIQSLNEEQKRNLELRPRYENDRRIRDRIKAVLLKSDIGAVFWTEKRFFKSYSS
jgi:hypothetical protein